MEKDDMERLIGEERRDVLNHDGEIRDAQDCQEPRDAEDQKEQKNRENSWRAGSAPPPLIFYQVKILKSCPASPVPLMCRSGGHPVRYLW